MKAALPVGSFSIGTENDQEGGPSFDVTVANVVAANKEWATGRARLFRHFFNPLTNCTAEKHWTASFQFKR